jgi:hypothetical protein
VSDALPGEHLARDHDYLLSTPMPSAARLPPRIALRRDVEIPVLPGLGLTWYDRGPRSRGIP